MTNTPNSPEPQLTADKKWAKDAVADLLFQLFLNIRLVEGRHCNKFIEEMTPEEYVHYSEFLRQFFERAKKTATK